MELWKCTTTIIISIVGILESIFLISSMTWIIHEELARNKSAVGYTLPFVDIFLVLAIYGEVAYYVDKIKKSDQERKPMVKKSFLRDFVIVSICQMICLIVGLVYYSIESEEKFIIVISVIFVFIICTKIIVGRSVMLM